MVYATTDKEKNPMVLGLKPLPTKSGQDSLEALINLLGEISESTGNKELGDQLIVKLKNTRSDRAATEKKFNELLQEYREGILKKLTDDFENMSKKQIDNVIKMNNFFCGLHLLVSKFS